MSADAWAELADAYAANRTGYSHELYDTISSFGLRRGATIIDVGCGTGLASQPFAVNGFPVTGVDASEAMLARASELLPNASLVCAPAEALPFPNERFDVALSAQSFHWFDRSRALAEIHRVLRSGGMVAIWWKHLATRDLVSRIRDEVLKMFGGEAIPSRLTGGFKEFYAAPFSGQIVRVVPWRTTVPLQRFIGYERSRCGVRKSLGDRMEPYVAELEQRLRMRFGDGDPLVPVGYLQYLYVAKKP